MAQDPTDLHTRTSTTGGRERRDHPQGARPHRSGVVGAGRRVDVRDLGRRRVQGPRGRTPMAASGSRMHHSFGVWPALIDDHTEVLTCDPGRELLLKARGWPAGEAHVRIQVTMGNTPDSSIVSIVEDVTGGPAGSSTPRPATAHHPPKHRSPPPARADRRRPLPSQPEGNSDLF